MVTGLLSTGYNGTGRTLTCFGQSLLEVCLSPSLAHSLATGLTDGFSDRTALNNAFLKFELRIPVNVCH
jgi:hypothetical protein